MTNVLVLCYHAVSPTWTAELSVTPDALEAQLGRLVRAGWRGVTFRDALFAPPHERTLAVTFDDAFLSVREFAYPILSHLDLPATVFVPTAFPSTGRRLEWQGVAHWLPGPEGDELRCMSWSDLGALVSSGWEVGSHTHTHPHLTQLDDDRLRSELEESRHQCRQHLGVECDTAAYPYGDVDDRVAACAASAGYVAGAALSRSLRPIGFHQWPRIGIYHTDATWRFRLKVSHLVIAVRASRLFPTHL